MVRNYHIKAIILIGVIVGTVLGLTFGLGGLEQVDYNCYALKQNVLTKEIDDEVYEAGLYWVGIQYDMIRFPSTWQTIEFIPSDKDENKKTEDDKSANTDTDLPLEEQGYGKDIPVSSRTEDGLDLSIDLSFQYKLNKDTVKDLYSAYTLDYSDAILRIARGVIRDVSSKYDALEFFYNRSQIDSEIKQALIDKEDVMFVEIGEFQLREINLPDSFENAIELVEVAKQEIKIAEYQQQAATIRASTLIIEAQAQYNISIIEAQATAQVLNITFTAQAESLFHLAEQLGFNSTQLLTYLWIQAIEHHDSAYLIICSNTPNIFLDVSNSTEP